MEQNKFCKFCRWFNFKVSADFAWGECLNPEVINSQKISLTLVMEIYECPNLRGVIEAVKQYGRILYREDLFGCRYWEEL